MGDEINEAERQMKVQLAELLLGNFIKDKPWNNPPPKKTPYDISYHIMLLGDSNVGKTSLLRRYTTDTFDEQQEPTVGREFITKDITIHNEIVRLNIHDLTRSDQETFTLHERSWLILVEGIILVYDITKKSSFLTLQKWMNEIKTSIIDTALIILVGNKCDLEGSRQVTLVEAQEMFKKEPRIVMNIETSARDNIEVTVAFEYVVKQLRERWLNSKDSCQVL